jgi:hypothetical protein
MIDEYWLSERFKELMKRNEFSILLKLSKESPDFVISVDGKKIGVELKGDTGSHSLATGVGQLLFGKTVLNLDELWLIVPPLANLIPPISREWLETVKFCNIKIFSLQDDSLVEIKEDMVDTSNRFILLRSTLSKDGKVQFPLSKRMEELIRLVKQTGEVSFPDLAQKLRLTDSGFRSLVAMTLERTDCLEKFRRNNRKWLRFRLVDTLNERTDEKID